MPSDHPAWALPSIALSGVRTFLVTGRNPPRDRVFLLDHPVHLYLQDQNMNYELYIYLYIYLELSIAPLQNQKRICVDVVRIPSDLLGGQ